MGSAGQFVCVLLFAAYSRVQLFPCQRAGRCEHCELGTCYLGRCARDCFDIVSGTRQKGLQGPRRVYSWGQERRDGVTDGVKTTYELGAACRCTQNLG